LQRTIAGFIREERALRILKASPLYDAIYGSYLDSVREDGHACIIQPYLGATLISAMEESGSAYSVATTVDVLRQLLQQLDAAAPASI
jgi:hypothetical protein